MALFLKHPALTYIQYYAVRKFLILLITHLIIQSTLQNEKAYVKTNHFGAI